MKTTTEEQRERWRQGCQAVFAGFVASAHHRGLPASIDIFWLTEQRETITPSLRDLQAEDPGTDAETEARLKGALYKLLLEMNIWTRLKERDELERSVRWQELEWALTVKGRKMFPIIMPVQLKAATAPSTNINKDWWNA